MTRRYGRYNYGPKKSERKEGQKRMHDQQKESREQKHDGGTMKENRNGFEESVKVSESSELR